MFSFYGAVAAIAHVVLCNGVSAQPTDAPAPPREPLRIGVMALAPYGYRDSTGQSVGNFFELSQAILKEGGFDGYAEIVPVHRVIKLGHTDCAITADVERIMERSIQVAEMGIQMEFGVIPLRSMSLDQYDDLKNMILAIPVGASMGAPFDLDETLNKVEVHDYSAAMLMLDRGRVEGAVGVIGSLQFSAFLAGVDPTQFGKPLIFKKRNIVFHCHPSSKTKPYWDDIKAAIGRMKDKGMMAEIMDKYR